MKRWKLFFFFLSLLLTLPGLVSEIGGVHIISLWHVHSTVSLNLCWCLTFGQLTSVSWCDEMTGSLFVLCASRAGSVCSHVCYDCSLTLNVWVDRKHCDMLNTDKEVKQLTVLLSHSGNLWACPRKYLSKKVEESCYYCVPSNKSQCLLYVLLTLFYTSTLSKHTILINMAVRCHWKQLFFFIVSFAKVC